MPDLSIIIPIYNTPTDALLRCFSSTSSLAGICWEVILVDDGSEAAVGEFCKQYAEEHHSNFRYFYKGNGGVSSARNFGLDQAKGTFVMFVDADDTLIGASIDPQLLQQDVDLTVFDMLLQEKGSQHIWHSLPCSTGTVAKDFFLQQLLCTKNLNSPCVKLFRRSVIANAGLRFHTDFITGEDWLFVTEFTLLAQSFYYERQPCYCYFRDAATGSSRLARFPDTMLQNYAQMFSKKQQIIVRQDWHPEDRPVLLAANATIMTEDMFNSAAELLLLNKLTPIRRSFIQEIVACAKAELPWMPRKSQLKARVLLYFPAALWPLAKLRQAYLKIK